MLLLECATQSACLSASKSLLKLCATTCLLPAVDGFNVLALKPGTVTELLLTDSAGQQQRTFADKDGWFTVLDVAPGSYVLTTYNPMFVYPEVSVGATAAAVHAGVIQDHATAGSLHSRRRHQQPALEMVVYIRAADMGADGSLCKHTGCQPCTPTGAAGRTPHSSCCLAA